MFNVVEAFSGVGAQAKALEKLNIDFNIIHTCDWDINAIIAYNRIHNEYAEKNTYPNISDEEIDSFLKSVTLSMDGKKPIKERSYNRLSNEFKRTLYSAIKESKNLVSITDVKGKDLPNDIDLLTYSFPCQDLSLCGYWHGNISGIAREAQNRSGMLWEVERVLKEMHNAGKKLPLFLVMENVTNILSSTNKNDFNGWKNTLSELGYYNKIYKLNARHFGVPQKRERAYMISILFEGDSEILYELDKYFCCNNLENPMVAQKYSSRAFTLKDILKLDYGNPIYKMEADYGQPNDTPSRRKIWKENELLFDGKQIREICVNTVTTKQDRNPNSGLIVYDNDKEGKAKWRYLTPRECFMLMGFDEVDYDRVIHNNIEYAKGKPLLTNEKLIKMAGNSICVDVLEAIFKQLLEIEGLFKRR